MKLAIHAALAALLLAGAAVSGQALRAKTLTADRDGQPDYAALVPDKFGDWKLVPSIRLVTPVDSDALSKLIYSQVLGRGYVDSAGNLVMLLIAYGPRQSDRLQLHRPEICYVAEGFRVANGGEAKVALRDGGESINVRRLVATREGRVERITYWMRIGQDIALTQLGQQIEKLHYGLRGYIPDGALIRVSSVNTDAANAEKLHARFLSDLLNNVPPTQLRAFIGSRAPVLSASTDADRKPEEAAPRRL